MFGCIVQTTETRFHECTTKDQETLSGEDSGEKSMGKVLKLTSEIIGLCAIVVCVPVKAESLHDVVDYTVNNNPQLRTQADKRTSAEHVIDQAKSGYYPTLDINGGFGYEYSNNPSTRARLKEGIGMSREEVGFQFRQMLFDGFLTRNEVTRTTEATNAEAYGVYGQAELVALDAVKAYLNLLRQTELKTLAEENLEIHRTTNDQVKLRSERGVGKKADEEIGRASCRERV